MNAKQSPKDLLAKAFEEIDASTAPLNEKLAAYTDAARPAYPDTLNAYDRLVERLASSGADGHAPQVGTEMPEFLLPDDEGRLVTLSTLLRSGPLVLSFNRGHWCPYCRLEVRELKRLHADIAAIGAQVVSIVPDRALYSSRMRIENRLPFIVLTDIDLAYTLSLGLAFWVGTEIRDAYSSAGVDLPRFQGNDAWLLPIPATLVVASDGIIKASHVDVEFRRRMPMEDILKALNGASS